jgi:hypothetical protein
MCEDIGCTTERQIKYNDVMARQVSGTVSEEYVEPVVQHRLLEWV